MTIFVSIASYRDPELKKTLESCIENAKNKSDLRIVIAWQHCDEDEWDNLNEYKDDKRIKIIDINYKDSKGACWARSQIQKFYNNEDYYLQLDSHHRFIKDWDDICINLYKSLKVKGYDKPILTGYLPSYDPVTNERKQEIWRMNFDKFSNDGIALFIPNVIYNELNEPIPTLFLSAHFVFTSGDWVTNVPYDDKLYFHGEEISLAVRSYTCGYDLFHPHCFIAWHEYTRSNRIKHWDDDKSWYIKNTLSIQKYNELFSTNFGSIRTLSDYQRVSGLDLKNQTYEKPNIELPICFNN